jgi:hypothetical protein
MPDRKWRVGRYIGSELSRSAAETSRVFRPLDALVDS